MSLLKPLICALALVPASLMAADQPSRTAHTNYILRCAGCHGFEGGGTPEGGIPDFPNSVGYIAGTELGRTYMMHVPGVVGSSLNNAEIAEVMNYVLDVWGETDSGEAPVYFTEEEVTQRRAEPVPDVVAYRRLAVDELTAMGITVADYPWP
jgi:cytochrome c553